MTKLPSLKLSPQGWSNVLLAGAALVVVYYVRKGWNVADKFVEKHTAPVGAMLSDLDNLGRGKVELTDLVLQPHLFDSDKRLTQTAWKVYTVNPTYRKIMLTLFDDNRVMKAEYHHLIGKPITEKDL